MITKELVLEIETKMKKTIESAKREFSEVRTGRAHPGLVEGMHIDYYGTSTLIKQLAAISLIDARTIVIQPWDASAIPGIEQAIANSKLGITPYSDGKLVRLSIPQLSEERRQELKKVIKDMAEKTRVSLRTIRRDANDRIKKMQNEKVVSEDECFKGQDEIQKLTDRYIKEVDALLEDKSKALVEL